MSNLDIRDSLHYYTFYERSFSLKLAADENFNLFSSVASQPIGIGNNRLKGLGLFNSSMLLYAVSVELIIKARALFEEKDRISNGQIKSFNGFLGKCEFNKHDYMEIIKKYKIDVSDEQHNIFSELKEYAKWAGRFPFPMKEQDVKDLESNYKSPGKLSAYNEKIGEFIESQKIIMGM